MMPIKVGREREKFRNLAHHYAAQVQRLKTGLSNIGYRIAAGLGYSCQRSDTPC